jgi:hypothetical protein
LPGGERPEVGGAEAYDPAGHPLADPGGLAAEAVRVLLAEAAHADHHDGQERKADRREGDYEDGREPEIHAYSISTSLWQVEPYTPITITLMFLLTPLIPISGPFQTVGLGRIFLNTERCCW